MKQPKLPMFEEEESRSREAYEKLVVLCERYPLCDSGGALAAWLVWNRDELIPLIKEAKK